MSAVLKERRVSAGRLPLSELVEFNPKPARGSIADDLAVTFVPMAAVEAGSGRMDMTQTRAYGAVKKGFTYFCDGDVLFAKITPCMENGKMAVARGLRNGIGFGSTEFHVLRPRKALDAKYLYHFVSSSAFRGEASHHMTGAVGQKRVPLAFLQQSEIPLPTIEQQRRIVAEIEKQFSRLDEAIANIQRVKGGIVRYRSSLLSASVAGDWPMQTIGALLREPIVNGLSVKESATPTTVRALRLNAMTSGGLNYEEHRFLPVDQGSVADIVIEEGDFFVSRGNGSLALVGRGATAQKPPYPVIFPDTMMRLRFLETDVTRWIAMLWPSRLVRRQLEQRVKTTAGIYKIAQPQVASITVPLPPPAERHRIVAEVDRRLSIVREVEAEAEANLKRAQALRQAVLQRAFSGRLVVNQPTAQELRPALNLIPGTTTLMEAARVALSAEITHQLHSDPSFGQVKHQKVFHLCEHTGQLDVLQVHYRRAGYGPLNMQVIEANERVMEQQGWYAQRRREGSAGHHYVHLSRAGEHKPYLHFFSAIQLAVIRHVIDLMRGWNTDQCERFSTVYAAWNDLLILGREATPDAILREVLELWDEKKKRFSRKEWLEQIDLINQHGFVPTGFGQLTRSPTDGVTSDLFHDSAH